MHRGRALLVIALATGLVSAGCSSNEPESAATTTTLATTTTTSAPVGDPPTLKLSPVATLDHPLALAQRTGDDALYVAEKRGTIRMIRAGSVVLAPTLDISKEVSSGSEQGLLGLAFDPKTRLLYVDFTDASGDTHVVEFIVDDTGVADIGSRRELLIVDQPFPNHNGGQLAFGPDGYLYIGLGDGGSGGDPLGNAQSLVSLLGKILRIDPGAAQKAPYTSPYDNPFTKSASAHHEIWAYGLRNPWRFSFDANGGLWIGDVGQSKWEEVDYIKGPDHTGGQNYGWPLREGTHSYSGDKPTSAVEPIHEYSHNDGSCSITGGYRYRGTAIPELSGRYVFADFCTGVVSTLTAEGTDWEAAATNLKVTSPQSFGEDANGELYVLSADGTVSRIDGE